MANYRNRQDLLSSTSRIQVPWIKVTIGEYTFGVFDKKTSRDKDSAGYYTKSFDVQYPQYVESLNIQKINGQVNTYTLQLRYPVRVDDDPNLIEKILSSVSRTRKIVFSYGDASNPAYIYKNEEAIITSVQQSFNMESTIQSVISYTIKAVSGCALAGSGAFTFANSASPKKPSDEIKRVFRDSTYGLQDLFKGMSAANIDALIDSSDQAVELETKINVSPLDYINYLVGCMYPVGTAPGSLTSDMYILTIHDETVFDNFFGDTSGFGGPYFKITRVSNRTLNRSDAFNIDIGINTSTTVVSFTIENNENYSLLYNYNSKLSTEKYASRLNTKGEWEQIFAPMVTSGNDRFLTRSEDAVWFTKLTKYPINATIRIQGLLRPATLMQYVRLNVIFPGGNRHISSGLYIVTKQIDELSGNGYFTTLSMTRISD
jgi:hypothetical protein